MLLLRISHSWLGGQFLQFATTAHPWYTIRVKYQLLNKQPCMYSFWELFPSFHTLNGCVYLFLKISCFFATFEMAFVPKSIKFRAKLLKKNSSLLFFIEKLSALFVFWKLCLFGSAEYTKWWTGVCLKDCFVFFSLLSHGWHLTGLPYWSKIFFQVQGAQIKLVFGGIYLEMFLHFFQNLSQNCKFLFCSLLSVSHSSIITNARSCFLKFMFWS